MLSAEQRAAFDRDGFLVLPDVIDAAACAALRARALELVSGFDPREAVVFSTRQPRHGASEYFLTSGDKVRCFLEEEAVSPSGELRVPRERAVNKIGHALHDRDERFAAFSRQPVLGPIIASLGVQRPVLIQSMYIFKQPHIGGEVGFHQDATFLYTDPVSVIGLWFALEDAGPDNGCLWALPGAHKHGLRARFRRSGAGTVMESLDPRPWSQAGQVALPVRAGGVVVLHGLLPHRSDANRSARSRHAYALHVIDGASHYPADNWLQRPELRPHLR